jgi:hypothetical protein
VLKNRITLGTKQLENLQFIWMIISKQEEMYSAKLSHALISLRLERDREKTRRGAVGLSMNVQFYYGKF